MKHNKTLISTSILTVLGVGIGMMSEVASASLIADGNYVMTINNTPFSGGRYQFGSNGNWNSSFTFGCLPGTKGCVSNALYDDLVATPISGKYSGIPNDGVAGSIDFNITGGFISATSFNMDTISGTAAGDFNQYVNANLMTGSVDNAGQMIFTPKGRLAAVSGFSALVDKAWNIDNFNGGSGTGTNFVPNLPTSNAAWQTFTSGQACAIAGCIDGKNVVNVGDVNFDGIDDYTVTLVSAGQVGSQWGEFFGSGLLGLVGIASKRKN